MILINNGEGVEQITAQCILLSIKSMDHAQQLRHWADLISPPESLLCLLLIRFKILICAPPMRRFQLLTIVASPSSITPISPSSKPYGIWRHLALVVNRQIICQRGLSSGELHWIINTNDAWEHHHILYRPPDSAVLPNHYHRNRRSFR